MALSSIDFLKPWEEFGLGQADDFLLELSRELSPGHPLHDLTLQPLGLSRAADDALFAMQDGRVVEVHFTWSGKAERPPWPSHRFYSSVNQWIKQSMMPEHDGE